tara:strand:+ start:1312 stop:2067 length:756 start_codon:yes stop_codon:yes gene_type:complete
MEPKVDKKLPQHLAIVMDGNGRWAQARGLARYKGHQQGLAAVKSVIEQCLVYQIPVLSLFAFSSENWSRPLAEVEFLMQLFLQALQDELAQLNHQKVALRFIGERLELADTLQNQMMSAEQLTQNNQKLTLNIVINYGGRWDIVQASKRITAKVLANQLALDDINETLFKGYLSTDILPEPDLLIRTSGEKRLSNFFLWQLAYTELYFTETLWPDFNHQELDKALLWFSQRSRRYGNVDTLNTIEQEKLYV